MSYSRDIFNTVSERYSQKKHKNEMIITQRKSEVHGKIPRLAEIDRELSQTGLTVARAALSMKPSAIEQHIEGLRLRNLDLRRERDELLSKNGYPTDYLCVNYSCKICNDEGIVDGKYCSCFKDELKNESYKKLSKSSPLNLASFDTFSLDYYPDTPIENSELTAREMMEHVFKFCKEYADDISPSSSSLLLSGATGLGKTHLSLSIANEAIKKGLGVVYGSWQNLLAKVETEKFSKTYYGSEVLDSLLDCDLLIIDDLGAEFSNSFGVSVLYNIINTRICTGKTTIINTNLDIMEIGEKYTERVLSRIEGSFLKLLFFGNDIRSLCSTEF